MELISLILNFILSGSTIGMVIFYTSKKRKAAAEATEAELGTVGQEFNIQKQNIEFLSSQLQDAWKEVEKLQGLLNDSRNQIVELIAKTKQTEIELLEAQTKRRKAEVLACHNTDCAQRINNAA